MHLHRRSFLGTLLASTVLSTTEVAIASPTRPHGTLRMTAPGMMELRFDRIVPLRHIADPDRFPKR